MISRKKRNLQYSCWYLRIRLVQFWGKFQISLLGQMIALAPGYWMAARLLVILFWYRPHCFCYVNKVVITSYSCFYMTKAERSVSVQGQLQPRCHSKARSDQPRLRGQLDERPWERCWGQTTVKWADNCKMVYLLGWLIKSRVEWCMILWF